MNAIQKKVCIDIIQKRLKGNKMTENKNSQLNKQTAGDHYKKLGAYQPWSVFPHWLTPDELRGYAKGEVIAYLCRERDKNGIEDIKKAHHVLGLYLETIGEL